MFSERTQLRLRDILDNAASIEAYAGMMSFAQFQDDQRTIDAVERCLQRITEAVTHIGEADMQRILPDIPFEMIRGMGNKLRHEYHRIDAKQVYATVHDELPPLRFAVAKALE
jgi:uncharacterized protein with HEPN domain